MTRPDRQLRAATVKQLRAHLSEQEFHRDNHARAVRAARAEIRRRERSKPA